VLPALLAPVLASCRAKASRAQCVAMLERYVDMTLGSDPALAPLPDAERKAAQGTRRAAALAEPAFARAVGQCEREVSKGEHACAMRAPNPDVWQSCIE
jgi:hypothetical protein